jgi:hypothetical protein
MGSFPCQNALIFIIWITCYFSESGLRLSFPVSNGNFTIDSVEKYFFITLDPAAKSRLNQGKQSRRKPLRGRLEDFGDCVLNHLRQSNWRNWHGVLP